MILSHKSLNSGLSKTSLLTLISILSFWLNTGNFLIASFICVTTSPATSSYSVGSSKDSDTISSFNFCLTFPFLSIYH